MRGACFPNTGSHFCHDTRSHVLRRVDQCPGLRRSHAPIGDTAVRRIRLQQSDPIFSGSSAFLRIHECHDLAPHTSDPGFGLTASRHQSVVDRRRKRKHLIHKEERIAESVLQISSIRPYKKNRENCQQAVTSLAFHPSNWKRFVAGGKGRICGLYDLTTK